MSALSVMASTIITLAHCDATKRGHPRHQLSDLGQRQGLLEMFSKPLAIELPTISHADATDCIWLKVGSDKHVLTQLRPNMFQIAVRRPPEHACYFPIPVSFDIAKPRRL
jgi:hypothetical protein